MKKAFLILCIAFAVACAIAALDPEHKFRVFPKATVDTITKGVPQPIEPTSPIYWLLILNS